MQRKVGQVPGGSAPLNAASDIQPVGVDEFEAVEEADLLEVGHDRELERLHRLEGDERLLSELRQHGFQGFRYAEFERQLVEYALVVLSAWMYSGHIYVVARAKNITLRPTEAELGWLQTDPQLREDLAIMTIAKSLPLFKSRALEAGGWNPERGASLTTYFMGATVFQFPNEMRRERTQRIKQDRQVSAATTEARRRRVADSASTILDLDAPEFGLDPATQTVGRAVVESTLSYAGNKEQRILRLTLAGFHHDEIAEILGEVSGRAVEGATYRWRTKEKRRRATETGGDQ